jgi:hypothetical protein
MTLKENFEKLSDEELLQKITTKSFTSEADVIAREVLIERGLTPPDATLPVTPEKEISVLQRLKTLFIDCVTGRANLGTAYWTLGFLLFALVVLAVIGYELSRLTFVGDLFTYLLIFVLLLANPFHAFCVWRCGKNTNNAVYKNIAMFYAFVQLIFWCGLLPIAMVASLFN